MTDHAESVTLLVEWLAAGDAGRIEEFDRYLHDDAVVHAPMGLSTHGLDAERAVWREARAAMPDLRHEVVDVMATGDRAAVRTVVTGTLDGTFGGVTAHGRSFRIDQAVFAHVRGGKIVEAWEIVDTASLLRQLGALP